MPNLRQRAVRGVGETFSHLFLEPRVHKGVVNFLYSVLLTSPASEEAVALEFWQSYRHLAEGGSISDFPFRLVDSTYVVHQVRKILRGDPIMIDQEEDDE